jgi:hypothetical protein
MRRCFPIQWVPHAHQSRHDYHLLELPSIFLQLEDRLDIFLSMVYIRSLLHRTCKVAPDTFNFQSGESSLAKWAPIGFTHEGTRYAFGPPNSIETRNTEYSDLLEV